MTDLGRRPDNDVPFAEPWEARVFASAVLVCERLGLPWDSFREALKAAVAGDPSRPYYESVTVALRAVVDAAAPGR